MRVAFCGHGKINYDNEVRNKLIEIIEELIEHGADEFLLGGYGNFDIMSAHIVYDLKQKYPHIQSILIVPYLNRDYDRTWYDGSIYPPLEKVPKRFAIVKRNEWMVDNADVIISYVKNDWGGAYKTLEYAKKREKKL